MAKTVAIIGAGIGGLTCALALRKFGIEAQVFEAAPELAAVGAGIWMAPNAMQVFDRLGLAEEVLGAGLAMNKVMVLDDRLETIAIADQASVRKRFGFGITAIHRASLQQVLIRNLGSANIHLGKKLASLDQNEEPVRALFENGTETTADILIGADGIHSQTRRSILGERPLRYSGQVCWRAAVPFELPDRFEYSTCEALGNRIRLGFAHIAPSLVYWFAVKSSPPIGIHDAEKAKAQLVQDFAHFAEPVPSLIKAAAPADLIFTNLHDLPPRLPWSKGKVCLIGDAAHPMTPNMGQGGAQAVEDGYSLATHLAKHGESNCQVAFRSFELQRFKKVKSVVNTSYYTGAFMHSPWPAVRNFALRITPASLASRHMESIFRLDDTAGRKQA
jgi:2-polyprenyl-6-methoxyphenol hydroxylase-like FAD-dependent oxidoreductase